MYIRNSKTKVFILAIAKLLHCVLPIAKGLIANVTIWHVRPMGGDPVLEAQTGITSGGRNTVPLGHNLRGRKFHPEHISMEAESDILHSHSQSHTCICYTLI